MVDTMTFYGFDVWIMIEFTRWVSDISTMEVLAKEHERTHATYEPEKPETSEISPIPSFSPVGSQSSRLHTLRQFRMCAALEFHYFIQRLRAMKSILVYSDNLCCIYILGTICSLVSVDRFVWLYFQSPKCLFERKSAKHSTVSLDILKQICSTDDRWLAVQTNKKKIILSVRFERAEGIVKSKYQETGVCAVCFTIAIRQFILVHIITPRINHLANQILCSSPLQLWSNLTISV